ncbi:MAG: sugar O-acetyltransferase [Candidatus Nanopelagicales bacterium]
MRPTPIGPEYQNMISGRLYRPADPELAEYRQQARTLEHRFNSGDPTLNDAQVATLRELLGHAGEEPWIEQRLHVDYGINIHIGDRFYANANCVLLDVAEIRIGDDVMLAPAVGLYTATHPVDAETRVSGVELGYPITIGNRVWLGGGVIVCPGVTIGDDTVVGAGAVVTKDLPARVVAVGNPARVIKEL